LEREGIPVDYLAGTSMGGVIAAGYAAGMSSYDIEREASAITQKRRIWRLVDPGLPNGGLIRGHQVLSYLKGEFGEKTFSELHLPLGVVTVDLNSHQEVVIRNGPLALALRATTSIPGLFMPVETNGCRLVDGGVLNNLPIDVARKMGADVVIAVDIGLAYNGGIGHWIGKRHWMPNGISSSLEALDDTLYTLRIVEQENKLAKYPPNVLICPNIPTSVNVIFGYNRVAELIEAGELAAEEHLAEIKELLRPRWHCPLGKGMNYGNKNLTQSLLPKISEK
jgi:NTE family protein